MPGWEEKIVLNLSLSLSMHRAALMSVQEPLRAASTLHHRFSTFRMLQSAGAVVAPSSAMPPRLAVLLLTLLLACRSSAKEPLSLLARVRLIASIIVARHRQQARLILRLPVVTRLLPTFLARHFHTEACKMQHAESDSGEEGKNGAISYGALDVWRIGQID